MAVLEKKYFKDFSLRVGTALSKLKISPNGWTCLTFVFVLAAAWFVAKDQFLPAAFLFLISGLADFFDGAVARATGKLTRTGAFFDTVADRYVEAIIIFSFLFATLPNIWLPIQAWIFLLLLGSLLTPYVKAAANEKGLVKGELTGAKGGLLGRPERIGLLFIGILLAAFNRLYLSGFILGLAILTNFSAIQRVFASKQIARRRGIK